MDPKMKSINKGTMSANSTSVAPCSLRLRPGLPSPRRRPAPREPARQFNHVRCTGSYPPPQVWRETTLRGKGGADAREPPCGKGDSLVSGTCAKGSSTAGTRFASATPAIAARLQNVMDTGFCRGERGPDDIAITKPLRRAITSCGRVFGGATRSSRRGPAPFSRAGAASASRPGAGRAKQLGWPGCGRSVRASGGDSQCANSA
jgi:hypothetical protein